MKQPVITWKGEEWKVANVWWNEDGTIAHITYFTDEDSDENIGVIFQTSYETDDSDDFEHHPDLEQLLKEG